MKQVLQKYIDQPVQLVVYSSKTRTTRGEASIQWCMCLLVSIQILFLLVVIVCLKGSRNFNFGFLWPTNRTERITCMYMAIVCILDI